MTHSAARRGAASRAWYDGTRSWRHAGQQSRRLFARAGHSRPGAAVGAAGLAAEYLGDDKYRDDGARVAALIKWETAKNFTTGFLTGLGGFITLPVAVPAALAASWVVQARMAAAIACIYGTISTPGTCAPGFCSVSRATWRAKR